MYLLKRNETVCPQKDLYMNFHGIVISYNQIADKVNQ